jgi:hypothetical protein
VNTAFVRMFAPLGFTSFPSSGAFSTCIMSSCPSNEHLGSQIA